ncbi:MAG: DEAD/DEAH box helicase [Propionibacteriaceae bacterium]|jgi:superfamily II DNA/RNA helicase|nr:DEAD/DEAH box helicase [Propionibacteriaceae bacterium]
MESETSPLSATTPADPGTFADLGVMPAIVDSLTEAGFDHPFPIQHLAIPIALQGTDLIGQARTGTGKTLAFGIPILQRIALPGDADYEESEGAAPQALVLCPTRELALQVTGDLEVAGRGRGARVLTVYGGVGYEPQLDSLTDGVDVVVGTPGRIIDLMGRHSLVLSKVKILVLDEGDEMLDLGFLPDVERIVGQVPVERQTMLFSATMPGAIVALSRAHLRHPINIRAEAHDSQMTVPETTQFVYQAHDLDKPAIVGKLLQSTAAGRVMVFCRTKRGVQRLADDLVERGFKATCIHGDLSQIIRERALAKFREGKAQVIVATDVAARGIDVEGVTHVINYDCPDSELTYVHRIGRTGRAGRDGVAITLVDWADMTRWKLINKALNLPFDNPLEAYSTTPELLEELGVPEGATGRLVPPSPVQRPARDADRRGRDGRGRDSRGRDGRDRDGGDGRDRRRGRTDRDDEATAERPRERRARDGQRRTRTRQGVVVAPDAPASAPADSTDPAAARQPGTRDPSSTREPGTSRRRRRPTPAAESQPQGESSVAATTSQPATVRRRRRRGSKSGTDAHPASAPTA